MAYQDLVDVDVLAEAIAHLGAHPALTAALGGPGRVGGENVPPYPRLILSDPPGGDDRGWTWLIARNVLLEAVGDLDGRPGKAALARIMRIATAALHELPTRPAVPGKAVVTAVTASGGAGYSPYPTGQPRYLVTHQVWAHPGKVA